MIGYGTLAGEYPPAQRSNTRVLIRSSRLADSIYGRVQYVAEGGREERREGEEKGGERGKEKERE